MPELTQCYKIRFQSEQQHLAAPAQYIYQSNDDERIIGFISNKDGSMITVATFSQIELPEGGVNIKARLTNEELNLLLDNALEQNPEMKPHWEDLEYVEEVR